MNIQKSLREVQDKVRDEGWRIKWIPWQDAGRVEQVYNTPLTLLSGFGGAAVFVGAVWFMASGHAQWPVLVAALTGLLTIFLGRIYAAFNKQAGWIRVTARCIDRDLQERDYPARGNVKVVWECRLLCEFSHDGREYRVTPEASRLAGCPSRQALAQYLQEKIQPDGLCTLWIDPENPLHAVFEKKQWI
ncbi:MAG: hypothetical protein PSX71_13755 [bacterium]|nr:hypothetical protein [bacterium]